MTPRLPRLRLAARLAIAIILAVTASFLLDQTLRALIPPPPFLVVQRAWLIGEVERVNRAFREAGGQPGAAGFLDLQLSPDPGFAQGGSANAFAGSLQSSLAHALSRPTDDVRIQADMFSDNFWERSASTAVVIIPRLPVLLTSQEAASNSMDPKP